MPEIPLNEFIDQQDTNIQPVVNQETTVTEIKTPITKDANPLSLNEFLNVTGKDYIPYEDRKFDRKPIQDYWKRIYDETPSPDDLIVNYENSIKDESKGTPIDYLKYLGERIQIGWDGSTQGLVKNFIQGKELPLAYDELVAADKDWLGGFTQQVAAIAGDTGSFIVSGIGGAGTGAVVGGGIGLATGGPVAVAPAAVTGASRGFVIGGAFGTGALRATMVEAINKQQIGEPVDFAKIMLEEGLTGGAKEAIQLYAGLKGNKLLGPAGEKYFAKVLSRFTAFEGVGALIHGELPSARELSYSGILWSVGSLGEKGSEAKRVDFYKKKADQVYIETGVKPSQVMQDMIIDPAVSDQVSSINVRIPKKYVPKAKQEFTMEQQVESLKTNLNVLEKQGEPKITEKFIDQNGIEQTREVVDLKLSLKRKDQISKIKSTIDDLDFQIEGKPKTNDPALQHMYNNMAWSGNPPKKFLDTLKTARDKFMTTQLDFRDPLKRYLMRIGYDIKPKLSELNVLEQAYSLSRDKYLGEYFVLEKTINGKREITGESLADIFSKLPEKEYPAYQAYENAVFNRTIVKRGLKTPFDTKFSEQVATNKEYIKKYEPLRQRRLAWSNRVLDYLVDIKFLTKEEVSAMRELNEGYVNLSREVNRNQYESLALTTGSSLKEREGSLLKIIPPLTSYIDSVKGLVERGNVNAVRVELINTIKEAQKLGFSPEFKQITAKKRTIEQMRKELIDSGLHKKEEINSLSDKAIRQLDGFVEKNNVFGENKDTVRIKMPDGKTEIWKLTPELVRATSSGLVQEMGMIRAFINKFTRFTRGGSIFEAGFAIGNFLSDTVTTTMTRRFGGWVPVGSSLLGLTHIIFAKSGKNAFPDNKIVKLYDEFKRSSAAQATSIKADRFVKNLDAYEILNQGKLKNQLLSPWETYVKGFTQLLEESTRFRVFELTIQEGLKKGLSPYDSLRRAGYEAADIMDFGRVGTIGAYMNTLVAFWNAAAQGVRKPIVTIAENPGKSAATIFASIMLPTILEQVLYADDPRYQAQDEWIKENYWYMRINDVEYKIRKPFLPGVFFSQLTVDMMNFYKGNYKKEFSEFASDLIISNIKQYKPIPQAFLPWIEIALNKNLFTGGEVIPRYLDRNIPEKYQTLPYTSETMKKIADVLNFGLGKLGMQDPEVVINNPVKLEHIWNSYGSTVGKFILKATDKLLIETGTIKDPIKPNAELSDYPLFRAILLSETPKRSSYETYFNKEVDKLKKIESSIKFLESNNEFDKAAELRVKHNFLSNNDMKDKMTELKSKQQALFDLKQSIINIYNLDLESLITNQDSFKKLTDEQKQIKIEDIRQEKLQQIKLIRKYVIFTAASGLNTMGKKVPMPPDPSEIKQ
jgi:hypothetical protein